MAAPPDPLQEATERAVEAVSRRHGTTDYGDHYTFFARSGDNWDDYPFSWEAFRDLAGGSTPTSDAHPVVVVSTSGGMKAPEVSEHTEPVRHTEILVSPTLDRNAIVEAWIAAISSMVEPTEGGMEWFPEMLELKPDELSPAALAFLGLEAPATPNQRPGTASGFTADTKSGEDVVALPLSATLRDIESELGASPTTSFAIAEALRSRHPEYAAGGFAALSLDPPDDALTNDWAVWRDSVAGQYDAVAVASSRHQVLDGRLFLIGLALLDPPLRERLRDARGWAQLLLEVDDAAAGPGSPLRNALESIQLAHGYLTDSVHGEDQLGIEGEVNAVCEVVTDPDVDPPLAVGLFGAWGSGKSFFMEKMRARIEELTTGPTARRPATVRQIRFNAWHYADTSLWASLAVEIFERLADPEPVDPAMRAEWLRTRGDTNKAARQELIGELETYREARAALHAERDRLTKERAELEKARNEATKTRKQAMQDHQLTNVLVELARDERVVKQLGEVEKRLGIRPAVAELETLGAELRTLSGHLTHAWRLIDKKEWTVVAGAAFLTLALTSLAYLTSGENATLEGILTGLGSTLALVATGLGQWVPAVRKANEALGEVETGIEVASQTRAELADKRSREERSLDVELEQHRQALQEKSRAITELDQKITSLNAQVDALAVGRSLYDFLADRAAGYKKHQGVVGMLHRDFRLLDAQLRAHAGDADRTLPSIDRVVLYVDDLDRCPPEKVLEVLEAVHLLLALPLFIVVVGVDPRWLDRSLRHQYRELATTEDAAADPYLAAMPTEYLEKIFQIALTLPAMEPASFARLIGSMAPSVTPSTGSTPRPTGGSQRRRSQGLPGGDTIPTRSLLTVQPGSAASGDGTGALDLTRTEIEFAQKLGPLVDSPRAAKRLMNTYRLIRATRSVGSSSFLGSDERPGEFQAVLTLLAVGAGFPVLADRLLAVLERDARRSPPRELWSDFVAALQPPVDTADPNDTGGEYFPVDLLRVRPGDALGHHERAQWINLAAALAECAGDNTLTASEPYHRWGPVVARFSFTVE